MKKNLPLITTILALVFSLYGIYTRTKPAIPKRFHHPIAKESVTRGKILGHNGAVLAESVPYWEFHLDPQANAHHTNVWNNARVATVLAKELEIDRDFILDKLENEKKKRYILIKATYERKFLDRVKKHLLDLRLCVEEKQRRRYPLGRAACHIVGTTIDSGKHEYPLKGAFGIESRWNERLSRGENFSCDLIPDVQVKLHSFITNAVATTEAEAGWGVVISTDHDEVFAMASYPDYDPMNFKGVTDEQFLNRPALYGFTPSYLISPLLSPAITNDNKLIAERLEHLGFSSARNDLCEEYHSRIWTPSNNSTNHTRVFRQGGLMTQTSLQIARAYAQSARECNPIAHKACIAIIPEWPYEGPCTSNLIYTVVLTDNNRVATVSLRKPKNRPAAHNLIYSDEAKILTR